MSLDHQTVGNYMKGFLGYGNPAAKWWFVGTEEGGGKSLEEVQGRVAQWHARGERPVENLKEFCLAVNHGSERWFGHGRAPQPTWDLLIRAMLMARNNGQFEHVTQDTLNYRKNRWGSSNGNTFLCEVLPLPSPNGDVWKYSILRWWANNACPPFAIDRVSTFCHSSEARGNLLKGFFANPPGNGRIIIVYASKMYRRWLFHALELGEPDFCHRHPKYKSLRIAVVASQDGRLMVVEAPPPTRYSHRQWNQIGPFISEVANAIQFQLPPP
jgi:hypothetical protein